ncbi:dihydropteroate synthase [Planctobacterium marinum]|uniref:Dihydropteroate synthase n=1 Tax=Planctobacterium marinum TaxID=1631968 RepID=A0AA48KQ18_9ALTE|nr:dihydropteroate synthase [Planctobacterium marinum]
MTLQHKLNPDVEVMGILNVTPDSFSDGGKFNRFDSALAQAEQMAIEGASIIDIGGESTRPGAAEVSLQEELERTVPVIEQLSSQIDVRISIDTSKPQVMREAVNAGATLINDVRALQLPGALEIAASSNADVCLMHMQGQPRTMQDAPRYEDLLKDIMAFFRQRVTACEKAGIPRTKLILDPGFGFGKALEHNYEILGQLDYFDELQLPLLIGLSRKSMIGNLLNRSVEQRLAGSLSGALIAALQGAKILRVHDVKETVDALNVLKKTIQLI